MDYRNLGRTGLKVSELCLGTMQFGWTADEEISFQILTHAFNAGINFIDTADVYSFWAEGNPGGVAESIIGKWLQRQAIPRHEVVIATKVRGKMGDGPNDEGLSRAHILQAVDDSLDGLPSDLFPVGYSEKIDDIFAFPVIDDCYFHGLFSPLQKPYSSEFRSKHFASKSGGVLSGIET